MTRSSVFTIFASACASFHLAACATASSQEATAETPSATIDTPDYTSQANWLCLPGRDDACAADLDAAVISAKGAVTVEKFERADSPGIDCFYVYPTVSQDLTPNSDMEAGEEEASVVAAQFARFGSVCRTFAPLYRQVTLASLRKARPNSGNTPIAALPDGLREIAYADIRAAWQDYIQDRNDGRGVILFGHSQGAGVLMRLIAEEIEGSANQDKVVAAYLVGFNVTVPENALVGGDFQSMPLCSSRNEIGCVVAYSSFPDNVVPSERAPFGRSYRPDMRVACVNPPAPGQPGSKPMDAYLSNTPESGTQGDWVEGRTFTHRFVKLPEMISGQCVEKAGANYLDISIDRTGVRKVPSFGALSADPNLAPVWGLHRVDVHLAIGDLVRLAEKQGEVYLRK